MNFFYFLLVFFISSIETIIFSYLLTKYLNYKSKAPLIIGGVILVLINFILSAFKINLNIKLLIMLILCIFYTILFFENSKIKSIFRGCSTSMITIIVTVFMVYFMNIVNIDILSLDRIRQERFIIGIAFLIIIFVLLVLFERFGYLTREKTEMLRKIKNKELEISYMQDIETSIQKFITLKHDWKHQLVIIQALVDNQDYIQLKKYLAKVSGDYIEASFLISTGYTTFDAIVSNRIVLAIKNSIRVEHEIILPKILPLDQADFCILFENLLDNAIEACLKINNHNSRYISLKIYIVKEMLYIIVKNSSLNNYNIKNNILLTTKKFYAYEHGIGCNRIKEIANQVDGFCEFLSLENEFTAKIILPLVIP